MTRPSGMGTDKGLSAPKLVAIPVMVRHSRPRRARLSATPPLKSLGVGLHREPVASEPDTGCPHDLAAECVFLVGERIGVQQCTLSQRRPGTVELAMMIVGFGLVGVSARRRARGRIACSKPLSPGIQ